MNDEIDSDERIPAALWIGSPQNASEHSRLYQWLLSHTERPLASPSPLVMFDDLMMPVEEVVEAFSTDETFSDAAASAARKRGLTEASMGVMLFSSDGKPLWRNSAPDGELAYIGTFAFPTDDLPAK